MKNISTSSSIRILFAEINKIENEIKHTDNKKYILSLKRKKDSIEESISILQFVKDEIKRSKLNFFDEAIIKKIKTNFVYG